MAKDGAERRRRRIEETGAKTKAEAARIRKGNLKKRLNKAKPKHQKNSLTYKNYNERNVYRNKDHIKKKKKKPKKMSHSFKFPPKKLVEMNQLPWHKEKECATKLPPADEQNQLNILKELGLDEKFPMQSLNLLEEEILQFNAYIRLDSDEVKARNFCIDELKSLCCKTFPSKSKYVDVRLYGSFATDAITTFLSDVDLAIYGLVHPEKPKNEAKNSAVKETEQTEYEANIEEEKQPRTEHTKKEEKSLQQLKSDYEKELEINFFGQNREALSGTSRSVVSNTGKYRFQGTTSLFKTSDSKIIDIKAETAFGSSTTTTVTKVSSSSEDNSVSEIAVIKSDEVEFEDDENSLGCNSRNISNEEESDEAEEEEDNEKVDKMNSFTKETRVMKALLSDEEFECYEENIENETEEKYPSSDDDKEDEIMESSEKDKLTIKAKIQKNQILQLKNQSYGPKGQTRKLVVRALNKLQRKLQVKQIYPYIQDLEHRRHARVPIIVYNTDWNVEMNIALGGHNGVDTSHFAKLQCQKYTSFASVVLVLKMLLRQMDLDKPFTGGIGSYKLYVLVAYHIDQHLKLGGQDRPAQILISFLNRYGSIQGKTKNRKTIDNLRNTNVKTFLSQEMIIPVYSTASGNEQMEGYADLSSIYKIEHCASLFEKTLQRLSEHWRLVEINLKENESSSQKKSYSLLSSFIDSESLKCLRNKHLKNAKNINRYLGVIQETKDNIGIAEDDDGKQQVENFVLENKRKNKSMNDSNKMQKAKKLKPETRKKKNISNSKRRASA